jgi:hypothetical protein
MTELFWGLLLGGGIVYIATGRKKTTTESASIPTPVSLSNPEGVPKNTDATVCAETGPNPAECYTDVGPGSSRGADYGVGYGNDKQQPNLGGPMAPNDGSFYEDTVGRGY